MNKEAVVEPGPFTCHFCKKKCPQIWALLEHVFTAHGVRITDEYLPNFCYPIPIGINFYFDLSSFTTQP